MEPTILCLAFAMGFKRSIICIIKISWLSTIALWTILQRFSGSIPQLRCLQICRKIWSKMSKNKTWLSRTICMGSTSNNMPIFLISLTRYSKHPSQEEGISIQTQFSIILFPSTQFSIILKSFTRKIYWGLLVISMPTILQNFLLRKQKRNAILC